MNVMRRKACLVVIPITVNNFDALFNCTPAGGPGLRRNEGSSLNTFNQVGWGSMLVFGRAHRGSTVGFLLLQRFSVGLVVESTHLVSPPC